MNYGAEGGTRTHTGNCPEVFETSASAIPPHRHCWYCIYRVITCYLLRGICLIDQTTIITTATPIQIRKNCPKPVNASTKSSSISIMPTDWHVKLAGQFDKFCDQRTWHILHNCPFRPYYHPKPQ